MSCPQAISSDYSLLLIESSLPSSLLICSIASSCFVWSYYVLKESSRRFTCLFSRTSLVYSYFMVTISSSTPRASSAFISSFMYASYRYLSSQLSQIFSHLFLRRLRLRRCSLQATNSQKPLKLSE